MGGQSRRYRLTAFAKTVSHAGKLSLSDLSNGAGG